MSYELTRHKYLNEGEVASLKLTLTKYEKSDVRNVCIIRLALESGARASELLNLTSADFDHKERAIYVHGLKRGRDRWIPLRPALFRVLKSLPLSIDGRPFAISYQRLHDIWQTYTPNPLKTFHSLRHTMALTLYRKHQDIYLVQGALGHRSNTTTQIYMTYEHSLRDLRRIIS